MTQLKVNKATSWNSEDPSSKAVEQLRKLLNLHNISCIISIRSNDKKQKE